MMDRHNVEADMPWIDTERRRYPLHWDALNAQLQALEQRDGNLLGVLERLRDHQLRTGFLRDDLHDLQCFRFPHPDDAQRFLSVQYNPARVQRLKLRFDALPPPRGDAVNGDCFLCATNIQWQYHGREFGYAIEAGGVPCHIWMNPFPLLPVHLVVASQAHIPQAWESGAGGSGHLTVRRIVTSLAALAARMPGYVGFYNGDGAGASLPAHFHYHFFRRRTDVPHFPLELSPARELHEGCAVILDYPVECMRWQADDSSATINRAAGWIEDWLRARTGLRPSLSANIHAMCDAHTRRLQIYFVPRDRERCYSPHMAGMIGGLEVLGELVLTTGQEKHDLDRGMTDYRTIEQVLRDIRVPL
jgi:hypothetical protein